MAKWILIKDIMGQVGFPTTPQGVAKRAIMENPFQNSLIR